MSRTALNWFISYLNIEICYTLLEVCELIHEIPQDLVLGSALFPLCTTSLSKVIKRHIGTKFKFYADDTQLSVHLFQKCYFSSCLYDVQHWISSSILKTIPEKAEFITFASPVELERWPLPVKHFTFK